jgi:hypothetical protein
MTKRIIAIAAACLAFAVLSDSQEAVIRQLMRAKARYAHRLLDAVVMEDFDTIRDQAFRLKAVGETGDFQVLKTPEYARQSDAFIEATESLIDAAREKDGDRAALAYMDVTLKCVRCHHYIREHLIEQP